MQIWLNYLDQILLLGGLALSLNLLLGYAGQVSVAHAAFAAIGGYGMGYLAMQYGWSFLPAALMGMLLAFVAGLLLALPAMNLSVEYLILLTLAASSVIIGVFTTFGSLGGTYGLISIFEFENRADIFGWHMIQPSDWVIPLIVLTILLYALCHRMGESPFGRVLKGIREDPVATQALGKNVFAYKLAVFGITAGMAGLSGAFYSGWLNLATPGVYGFNFSLTIFAVVIFGGMANLNGSLLGAAIVVMLDPLLKRVLEWFDRPASDVSLLQLIVYGIGLVVLMRLRPQGLLPEGFSLFRRLRTGKGMQGRTEMRAAEDWVPATQVKVAVDVHPGDDTHLDEAELRREQESERRWQAAPVVLQATGLRKAFGGIVAADELTLELRKGTITALVGPNGAGKTTVFNLLTGFIPPDAGSVRLNGEELVGKTPNHIARAGMVRSWQDVRLVTRLSVLDNVCLAVQGQAGENLGRLFVPGNAVGRSEQATRAKGMEWLTFVGMQDFADVPAGSLSYGQTKLVSLARVLATEADVLLLDEPASGIDTKWVDTMLDLVEAVREQGRTVCIVEHNLHVVGRLADHTYFMELGRITAQGTIAELTNTPRLAEAYFGTA